MTTIAQKADYVKQTGSHDGKHTCHWPECGKAVQPSMWGCKTHWFKLPVGLRNKIWATYRPGQEISKIPSVEYLKVAHEVQDWIKGSNVEVSGRPHLDTIKENLNDRLK